MKKKFSTEAKVGLFILLILVVTAYLTLDVSQLGFTPGGTYRIYLLIDSAEGVTRKTPVQIAGIPVGFVREVELTSDQKARVELELRHDVRLDEGASTEIRTRGVLGDTYLEIYPGNSQTGVLTEGSTLTRVRPPADYQELARDLKDLTEDLKEITGAIKVYTVSEKSHLAQILENFEKISGALAANSGSNAQNLNVILENLAALSSDFRNLARDRGEDVEVALERISEIAGKLNSNEGTLGRLINDDTTVDKVNDILEDVKTLTRPVGRLQATVDYHLEYLGNTDNFKNYFNLKLSTHPDKYFMFGVVYNPDAPVGTSTQREIFDTDGVITTVTRETQSQNDVRFNAQLAKQFSDFTLRGGLIESTGGVGLDYSKGPVTVRLDGYNFGNEGPSLKAAAELNVTRSIYMTGGTYLLGGTNEITGEKMSPDWFMGAGIRFTDEDLSSLIGGAGLILR